MKKLTHAPTILAALLLVSLAPEPGAQRARYRTGTPKPTARRQVPVDPVAVPPLVTGGGQEPTKNGRDADAASVLHLPSEGGSITLSSGEKRLDRVDMDILGRGDIHFVLSRRYRSQLDHDGILGNGWMLVFEERLFPTSGGDVVRVDGSGIVSTWTDNGGGYDAPTGYFGMLVENQDGTWILREPNGFKRHFLADGRLASYEDRHGNTQTFVYSNQKLVEVLDVFGRSIVLEYAVAPDGMNRLKVVRDFLGREVQYTQDANGDLTSARSPVVTGTSNGNDFPNGRTEEYTYTSGNADSRLNHNLSTVTFPNEVAASGPPAVLYTYGENSGDPLTFDRLILETLGGTNASGVAAGGTLTLTYQEQNAGQPLGDPTLERLLTTVTHRDGRVVEQTTNENAHEIKRRELTQGLRAGEPAYFETRYEYDLDGQRTRLVRPRGNGELRTYGTGPRANQGDLVEIRLVADATGMGGSAEEDRVSTFTSDPLFHMVVSETDPRGNSATFVPPMGAQSAARYTRKRYLDYQEHSDPVPEAVEFDITMTGFQRGLGDLNDDGRTDQSAGDVVRTESTVELRPDSRLAADLGTTTQDVVLERRWNDFGQLISLIDPEGNLISWSYFSAADPAGQAGPPAGEGGYLREEVVDAGLTSRRTSPYAPEIRIYTYDRDDMGNTTAVVDQRRVRHEVEVNALNEVVSTTRGADVAAAVAAGELHTGEMAYQYEERFRRDDNGDIVLIERENVASIAATSGLGDWHERTAVRDILGNTLTSSVEVDASTVATTNTGYDAEERQAFSVSPDGRRFEFYYDERGSLFRERRGVGTAHEGEYVYNYDANGNPSRFRDAADSDGDGAEEKIDCTFTSFDELEATNEELNRSTTYAYDPAGNVVSKVVMGHPAGAPTAPPVLLRSTNYTHDELNREFRMDTSLFVIPGQSPVRPVDLQDGNSDGVVTVFEEHDANGRVVYRKEDLGHVTEFRYDGAGLMVSLIDPLTNKVDYTYDAGGNLTVVTELDVSPEGEISDQSYSQLFVYDQIGQMVRETDEGGATREFTHDSLGNQSTASDSRGALLGSDPWGRFPVVGQTGQMNARGNLTTTDFDGLGFPIMRWTAMHEQGNSANPIDTSNNANPDGDNRLKYGWNLDGQQTSFEDDERNTTTWFYNGRGWLEIEGLPNGQWISYDYDLDGNPISKDMPDGHSVTWSHDALNRVIGELVASAPHSFGTTSKTFDFDGVGNVTATQNVAPGFTSTTEQVWDSLGARRERTSNGKTMSYTVDGNGDVVQKIYANDLVLTIIRDPLGRPRAASDSIDGMIFQDRRYVGPDQRLLRQTFGNGVMQINGFDASRRVNSVQHMAPPPWEATALVDHSWTHDREDNPLSEARGTAGYSRNFVFDSSGHLDGFVEGTTTFTYELEGSGTPSTETVTPMVGGPFVSSFGSNAMNSLTIVDAQARIHDALGNLKGDSSRIKYWDHEQRVARREQFGAGFQQNFYYAGGGLARREDLAFGADPKIMVHDDGFVVQVWQDDGVTTTLERTDLRVDGELVKVFSETVARVPGTWLVHHSQRGGLAMLTHADLMVVFAAEDWRIQQCDYTPQGLGLFYDGFGYPIQPHTFKDLSWNLDAQVYEDDHGREYEYRFGRNANRHGPNPSLDGTIKPDIVAPGRYGLGNGYETFDRKNPVRNDDIADVATPPRDLFMKRTPPHVVPGFETGHCREAVSGLPLTSRGFFDGLTGGNFRLLTAGEVQPGDLMVECPPPANFDPASSSEQFPLQPYIIHVGVVASVGQGRVLVAALSNSQSQGEVFDSRHSGSPVAFYRPLKNGKDMVLGADARCDIDDLARQTRFVPAWRIAPVIGGILRIGQDHLSGCFSPEHK